MKETQAMPKRYSAEYVDVLHNHDNGSKPGGIWTPLS